MQQVFLSQTEASAQKLLAAIENITENQAHIKPSETSWSVLECLEHIYIVEAWIVKTLKTEAEKENAEGVETVINRGKVSKILQNREFKVDAPEFSVPTGFFKSLEDAKISFLKKRSQLSEIINTMNLNDGVIVKHPKLGDMTKADWVHFMIEHTDRHINQIIEIKSNVTV
jgi:uncharacterized damage-inducible protein DinB